jgi:hypothetical protein
MSRAGLGAGPEGGPGDGQGVQDMAAQDMAAQNLKVRSEWARRRHLAAVFGDVLPAVTSDESGLASEPGSNLAADAWLIAEVPPHHGS